MSFLKDIGEYDNTIIIFMSDNGANPWYSHEYPGNAGSPWLEKFDNSLDNIGNTNSNYAYGMGWSTAGAGPLDLFKMTTAEGGIRSPMLIAGPGIDSGRNFNGFAYVTDIMPTILEMTGVELPAEFEGRPAQTMIGRSLSGVLSGTETGVYGADDYVGGELGGGKWIRQGTHKAVFIPGHYGSDEWALFNVEEDPGETHDLSSEMPERLDELKAAWDRYADEVGVVPPK